MHYPLVPSFKKINIGNTGKQNPPEGGSWLPVFPILIFVSRKPADNAKMVNNGLNNQPAKQLTGETTHLIRAKRPTLKTRAKRLGAKRPGETTHGRNDPDSSNTVDTN